MLPLQALEGGWEAVLLCSERRRDWTLGTALCHWTASCFLLWVGKFKMNSVHLRVLKFISLGKTKWVCSWPYFNAEIDNPQLSNDLSSKGVCESWCSFSDTRCCACCSGSQLRQESLCLASTTLRCHRPLSLTLPGMPWPRGLSVLPPCHVFGILPSVALQACSYLRDFSNVALCLEWSFLRNLYDHLLLPDEVNSGVSLRDTFPDHPRWSPHALHTCPIVVFQTLLYCVLACFLFPYLLVFYSLYPLLIRI